MAQAPKQKKSYKGKPNQTTYTKPYLYGFIPNLNDFSKKNRLYQIQMVLNFH